MCDMIGIIVTIVIGILTIWFSYWLIVRKKRPCEILFLAIDCINVYNKLSLDFDSLEIKTNGERIDNDLLFFSGVFVCNGHSDIKGDKHNLDIQLPKNCKWNDIKISSISRDLVAGIGINHDNPSKAVLNFGQFRMNEFITVKGLVECNEKKTLENLNNFHNGIKFFHRIEDTEKVKTGVIVDRQVKMRSHLLMQIPFLGMIVFTIIMMFMGTESSPIVYQQKDKHELYHARINERGNIVLHENSSVLSFWESDRQITLQDFKENYKTIAKYEKYDSIDISTYIIWAIMDLIVVIYLFFYNKRYFRDRKRMRMYVGER